MSGKTDKLEKLMLQFVTEKRVAKDMVTENHGEKVTVVDHIKSKIKSKITEQKVK